VKACGLRLCVIMSLNTSHEAIHERHIRIYGVFAEDECSGIEKSREVILETTMSQLLPR